MMARKLKPIIRRVDNNQKEIVKELRKFGATVAHTHIIGKGFPDIVVGYSGNNFLFEIKEPGAREKLTDKEKVWLNAWLGQSEVIENSQEAIEIIKEVIETTKSVGGVFIPIWHNDSVSDHAEWTGWRVVFEEMVNLLQ